ncbi:het domain-containing protein [Diaporthe amygdali]|uniref:het domain-containing protein n=1 Tax=Phomopsis amygdali TaxID=1214568 RepID=UPI0022FE763B|nr:het domain-containing protein [Diaporthe amygdali]KAJ0115141.1 het domain-containing protein [Diaporthe amygdali]
MRLLDTTTFELRLDSQEFFQAEGYAILSHRWVGAEITFDEIAHHAPSLRDAGSQRLTKSPQLDKIRGACEVAHAQGLRWLWIDSCCINKASATEEAESINSMFGWYRGARVCITYLSDVRSGASAEPPAYQAVESSAKKEMPSMGRVSDPIFRRAGSDAPSEWFFRGWTLQELLAPRDMDFYDADWNPIGNKASLAAQIQHITGIDADYLTGARDFRRACIATKMSWTAGRTTTRAEDAAYSLLGLFGIMMPPQYGEGGPRAFLRLQQQLLSTTADESIFAWRMPAPDAGMRYDVERNPDTSFGADEWGLLAPSPEWFRGCGNVTIEGGPAIHRPARSFEVNRQGLQVPAMQYHGNGITKYKLILLFSPLLFIGAIPVFFYIRKKLMKIAEEGVPFALNCWSTEGGEPSAAISVYLSQLPQTMKTNVGITEYKFKRVRCSELPLSHKYAVRGAEREVLVLQPELRFGN